MASYEELMAALRAAHQRGDTAAAVLLASQAREARSKRDAAMSRGLAAPVDPPTPRVPLDNAAQGGFLPFIASLMGAPQGMRPLIAPQEFPRPGSFPAVPQADMPYGDVVQNAQRILPRRAPEVTPEAPPDMPYGDMPYGDVVRNMQAPPPRLAPGPDYTPTMEAILSSLADTPKRVERGFLGNRLADAERDIVRSLQRIGELKNPQDAIAQQRANRGLWPGTFDTDIVRRAETALASVDPDVQAEAIEREQAAIMAARRIARATQDRIDQLDASMTPVKPAPGLPEALVSGIASFGDMAPGLAAFIVRRNPIPMMAYLGAYSRGSTYADKRAEGYDSEKAVTAANLYALAEAIPQYVPLAVILKRGTGAVAKIAGGAATEAASEALTSALQQLVDLGYLKEDMTWGEAVAEMQKSAAAGGVMGALMGGTATVADRAAQTVADRRARRGTPADPNAAPYAGAGTLPPAAPPPPVIDQIAASMRPPAPDPAVLAAPRVQAAPSSPIGQPAPLPAPPQPADTLAQIRAAMSGQPAPATQPPAQPARFQAGRPMTRAEVDADPDRFEVLDESEGQGRDWRATGGQVVLDKTTGQVFPLAPDREATDAQPSQTSGAIGAANAGTIRGGDAAGGDGTAQPPLEGRDGGQGFRPVAGSAQADAYAGSAADTDAALTAGRAPQADAVEAQSGRVPPATVPNQPSNFEFIDAAGVQRIQTEPSVMQYKAGGDAEGVTDRLRGVTEWRPERAGTVIVYEYADGRRVIADGHQRLALAKRLAREGKPIQMLAMILRQVDGVTPEEARVTAALKNIAEGSGTALDAAKVLRSTDKTPAQLDLPPNSSIVRDAAGMKNLSDQAFGMVVNGVASERDGGIVGRVVTDKAAQANILALLSRLQKDRPITAFQAEQVARQAAADTVTNTQDSLFGPEADTQNLYLERARIIEAAIKMAREEKNAFKNVLVNAKRLEAAGNRLDGERNRAFVDKASMIADYLQREANTKGAISEALTAAARALKGGATLVSATQQFRDAVERELGARGSERPSGDRGGHSSQPQRQPEPEPKAVGSGRNEDAADGDLFGAPSSPPRDPQADILAAMTGQTAPPPADPFDVPQTGKSPDRVRAEAEAEVRAKQSKIRKPGGNTGDAGPLFDSQQELFAPPKGEAANAPEPAKPPRETGADFLDRINTLREKYRGTDPVEIKGFVDLSRSPEGRALADQLAAADGLGPRKAIADAWVLERGKATKIEFVVLLDDQGRPVAIASGKRDAVSFPSYIWRMSIAGEVHYLTHNHPSSRGASHADIRSFLRLKWQGFAVMAHNGMRYEVERGPMAGNLVLPAPPAGTSAFDSLHNAANRKLMSILQARMIPVRYDDAEGIAREEAKRDRLNGSFDAIINLVYDRLGILSVSGDIRAKALEGTDGEADLESIIQEVAGAIPDDRLGRLGLDVAAIRAYQQDQAVAADAGFAGSQNGTSADGAGAGIGNGKRGHRGEDPALIQKGPLPAKGPAKTGNDALDGALDDIFGGESDVSGAGNNLAGGSRDGAASDRMGGTDVPAATGRTGRGNRGGNRARQAGDGQPGAGGGLPGGDAASVGAGSNPGADGQDGADRQPSARGERGGRAGGGGRGSSADTGRGADSAGNASGAPAKLTPAQQLAAIRAILKEDTLDFVAGPERRRTDSDFNRGTWDASSPYIMRQDADNPIDPRKAEALQSIFIDALDGVNIKQATDRQLFASIILPLRDAGMTRAEVVKLAPYLTAFLADLRAGRINMNPTLEPEQSALDRLNALVPGWTAVNGMLTNPDPAKGGIIDQAIRSKKWFVILNGSPRSVDGLDTVDQAVDWFIENHAAPAKPKTAPRIIPGDRANIDATVPELLPEQRDDVFKIETRFAKPDGHGFMLTNGTGTGKTYSGGGLIKRFYQQGKKNILIIAPDATHGSWARTLDALGVPSSRLANTTDAGEGVVYTTPENAGANNALASREWDMVVVDEAHKLSSNKDGEPTSTLHTLRAITHRPEDLWRKSRMIHSEDWAKYESMKDGDQKTAFYRRLKEREDREIQAWAQKPRSKVLFLSATPFAYDKSIDYAEGYLFKYPDDGRVGLSNQDGRTIFMVQNFGYRIRYHKLTKPEHAVDSAVFEREFHEKLKREGVLSGRSLQVDVDYDRRFVIVADAIGTEIDAILKTLSEGKNSADPVLKDGYRTLNSLMRSKFGYLARMQLLEAIKAKAAVSDIQKHLAMGRKVVVFHDFNKGGGFNPFAPLRDLSLLGDDNALKALADLSEKNPGWDKLDFTGYPAAAVGLKAAFGERAGVFSGLTKKDRDAQLAAFNTDNSGLDVLIVQADAGGAGVSMHDVTGTHPRVMINLGMPTKPTTTLQQEGRILRVGTKTNAAFRYYTIGTTWERIAFAQRIAERSGTVENLALGNEARAITDAFVDAYMDAEAFDPSDADGKGGKDKDRARNVTTPWQKAISYYFARAKMLGRRDQREGLDFYPTPEPLGLKMVEWAGIRANERVLEPSAGDGAIARFMPDDAAVTIVEPSDDLGSTALLRAPRANLAATTFEQHHISNKYHVVVMNPPFGSGGKTAMDHLAKAAKHLRPGGRLVALIPSGNSADKRFDAWWNSDDAKDFNWTADISLPAVTFERAGTGIMSRVVILDKIPDASERAMFGSRHGGTKRIDFTGASTITDFFDRLERYDVPRRPDPKQDVIEELEAEGQDASTPAPVQRPGPPVGGYVQFRLEKATHGKTGQPLFVAAFTKRVERDVYNAVLAVAKQHGGWYSSFSGNGAKPGFQFKSEAARQAFIADITKPTVAGMEETAYHGTPHDFDRFSLAAIGTGEGAQTYGWGLYFAGKRSVSEWYRDRLSRPSLQIDGEDIPSFLYEPLSVETNARTNEYLADKTPSKPVEVSAEAWRGGAPLFPYSLRRLIGDLRDRILAAPGDNVQERLRAYRDAEVTAYERAEQDGITFDMAERAARIAAIDWLSERVTKKNPGRVYTVDIPDQDRLLDWDAPLSKQPEAVKAAIRSMDAAPDESVWDKTTGRDLIEQLTIDAMGDAAFMRSTQERAAARAVARRYASEALRAAGIPGHRYLDGSSRSAGEGSYNYVIYDEAAIQILAKEQRAQMVREAAAATDEIRSLLPKLRAELDRLDLKRVRLTAREGDPGWQGAFAITGDGEMEILIGASLDPMKTLHHEVIHALRAMNLFTPEEWKALTLAAERKWLAKHDIAKRYPDLTEAERIEEAIAEEFSEALAAKESPKGSILVRAFNKIARVLRALRNVLQGAGYQTPEDIFGRVLAGEISARRAGNTGARAGMAEQRRKAAPERQGNLFGDRMMFQRPPLAVRPLTPQGRAHRNSAMGPTPFIPDRRIWETLTAAGVPIWQRLRDLPGAASDAVDRVRFTIQDRFLPVLRAQEAVMRQTGRPLPKEQDAYVAETTFSGKVGRHLLDIDERFTKPIIQIIAASKGRMTSETVGEYLYARHAIERNAYIASINPQMPDGGSGMLNADAQAILAQVAASPDAAAYAEIGRKVDEMREWSIALRENAGLISNSQATLWRKQYRHYVPLKGFEETDHFEALMDLGGVRLGRRFSVRGQETRRALGRRSEAFNPLQSAISMAQEVAIRAEKNRVAQALYELAKNHPSKALWEVKKPKQKRYFNRSTGLVETRVEDPVSMVMEPNEMAVKIGGEEHRILFMDERIAKAAGTLGADQMSGVVRVLSVLSRFFSMTRTMLSPEFMITNAFRDFQTAQFNIQAFGEADKARIAKAMAKNWRKAFMGAMRGSTYRFDTEWSRYYNEFQQAGAQVWFWTMENPEASREDLDRRIRLARGNKAVRALKVMTTPSAFFSFRDNAALAFIERTNLAVDNAIRLAAFVEARRAGWDVEKAAFLAKELTVNFNRRGEVGSTMNALYPFFNAAIQGTARTLKAISSRRVALMALTAVAAGAVLDLINASLSEEDDNGELLYDKVPNWRNERNLHLVLWGTGDNPAAIPMPYGYNVFPYAGQQIGKVMRGVKPADKAFADVVAAIFGAFSPISAATPAQMVSPFIADPLVEMAENKDWRGVPIYPQNYGNQTEPDAFVHFRSATEVSKWVAQTLNSLTGGDFRESGAVDISPETLDHLASFVVGSAGAFWGRSADIVVKVMQGDFESIERRNVPFLRNLSSPVGEWQDRDRYYRFGAEVKNAQADLKAYKAAGQPVPPKTAALAGLYDDWLKAERERARRGEWNPAKVGALAARDESKVFLDFNRKYIAVMGRQGE
jgi:hypothetical protein